MDPTEHRADPAVSLLHELDELAAHLLALGWVVRSPHPATPPPRPRWWSPASRVPEPATVLLHPHHHIEVELPHADAVHVDDVEDLHHHLNDLVRRAA